jgi:hypothetical protein
LVIGSNARPSAASSSASSTREPISIPPLMRYRNV